VRDGHGTGSGDSDRHRHDARPTACRCRVRSYPSSERNAMATTDGEGKYRLEIPSAFARTGSVQIKVDALGLAPKIYGVEINQSAPTTFDIALSLGFEEQVTVGSRAAGAESQKAVAGRHHHARSRFSTTGYAENDAGDSGGSPRRLIFHVRRSPTAPTPSAPATLRRPSDPTRCWCLVNGKRRPPEARLVHLNGSIGARIDRGRLERHPGLGDRPHRGPARRRGGASTDRMRSPGVINIVLKGGNVTSRSLDQVLACRRAAFSANRLHARRIGRAAAATKSISPMAGYSISAVRGGAPHRQGQSQP